MDRCNSIQYPTENIVIGDHNKLWLAALRESLSIILNILLPTEDYQGEQRKRELSRTKVSMKLDESTDVRKRGNSLTKLVRLSGYSNSFMSPLDFSLVEIAS